MPHSFLNNAFTNPPTTPPTPSFASGPPKRSDTLSATGTDTLNTPEGRSVDLDCRAEAGASHERRSDSLSECGYRAHWVVGVDRPPVSRPLPLTSTDGDVSDGSTTSSSSSRRKRFSSSLFRWPAKSDHRIPPWPLMVCAKESSVEICAGYSGLATTGEESRPCSRSQRIGASRGV